MTRRLVAAVMLLVLGGALLAAPALAAQAEPAIIAQAWYWKTQQKQSHDTPVGAVTVEVPDPFCPRIPGALGAPPESCAENRLPVEVLQGDYEEPDKVSAIGFDLSMMTLGSKVSKFTISLLEAEAGCREKKDSEVGQYCEQTDAINIEGKRVQACEVTDIFGDGDAREYKEMPKFSCDGTVFGTRKEIKNHAKSDPNDEDADHLWTFDLTPLAKSWAESPPLCTCIMLRPAQPQKAEDEDDNWRVVFAGPKFPKGVATNLQFIPGDEGLPPPPPPAGGGSGTDASGDTSSFGDTDVGGGLDSGTATDSGDLSGSDDAADDPAAATDDASATGAKVPQVETMPGYVWLAILAGLIGWSLVRSIVLETVHGQRPNGVLAQIHRINATRGGMHGTGAAAAVAGPLAGLKAGFTSVAHALRPIAGRVSSLAGKLPGIKRG